MADSTDTSGMGSAEVLHSFLREQCGLPEARTPLNARTIDTLVFDGFRIEKLTYDAEPFSRVPSHLYLPEAPDGPVPALVMACGHGGSKSVFFNQYAGQLYARAGIAVLSTDPLGEEERHRDGRIGTRAHDAISKDAQSLGRPVVGKMVWDLMCGIDYLETRRDVIDGNRIGTAGHSLGAIVSAYLAALDQRVRLALLAAMYFHPSEGGKFCTVGLYERIQEQIDYPQLLAMASPRCKTLMLVGDDDPICGGASVYQNGFAETFGRAKQLYAVQGREASLAQQVYQDAGHRPYFLAQEALEWVHKCFGMLAWNSRNGTKRPMISLANWADANGVQFERLYGTEQHYAGLSVPDVGVSHMPLAELACLTAQERGKPEFTAEGWLAFLQTE